MTSQPWHCHIYGSMSTARVTRSFRTSVCARNCDAHEQWRDWLRSLYCLNVEDNETRQRYFSHSSPSHSTAGQRIESNTPNVSMLKCLTDANLDGPVYHRHSLQRPRLLCDKKLGLCIENRLLIHTCVQHNPKKTKHRCTRRDSCMSRRADDALSRRRSEDMPDG
jgi:hypothetical protein